MASLVAGMLALGLGVAQAGALCILAGRARPSRMAAGRLAAGVALARLGAALILMLIAARCGAGPALAVIPGFWLGALSGAMPRTGGK